MASTPPKMMTGEDLLGGKLLCFCFSFLCFASKYKSIFYFAFCCCLKLLLHTHTHGLIFLCIKVSHVCFVFLRTLWCFISLFVLDVSYARTYIKHLSSVCMAAGFVYCNGAAWLTSCCCPVYLFFLSLFLFHVLYSPFPNTPFFLVRVLQFRSFDKIFFVLPFLL